jgi:hypothetical protein
MTELSRALDIRLAIGAAVYQWYEFKSLLGKNKNLSALSYDKKGYDTFRPIGLFVACKAV